MRPSKLMLTDERGRERQGNSFQRGQTRWGKLVIHGCVKTGKTYKGLCRACGTAMGLRAILSCKIQHPRWNIGGRYYLRNESSIPVCEAYAAGSQALRTWVSSLLRRTEMILKNALEIIWEFYTGCYQLQVWGKRLKNITTLCNYASSFRSQAVSVFSSRLILALIHLSSSFSCSAGNSASSSRRIESTSSPASAKERTDEV